MTPDELEELKRRKILEVMDLSQKTPFEEEQFAYMIELVKIYGVPEHILQELWGIINQVHQLTWFSERDMRVMIMELDNLLTRYRMSIPEYQYSYETDVTLKQVELMFFAMIKRSFQGFERKMQATQIRSVEYLERPKEQKRGLLNKIKGVIGLGGGEK